MAVREICRTKSFIFRIVLPTFAFNVKLPVHAVFMQTAIPYMH